MGSSHLWVDYVKILSCRLTRLDFHFLPPVWFWTILEETSFKTVQQCASEE